MSERNTPTTARELRVWHWRKVLAARRAASVYPRQAAAHNRRGDWHLAAVQVLNDHPECEAAGTTAEQDHETYPIPHNRSPKWTRPNGG